MLRYSLAKAATRPKGSRVTLPPQGPRLAPEKQYLVALRRILAEAARETREDIIPRYQADLATERAERAFTGDAEQNWFIRLRSLVASLTNVASRTVGDILDLEAKQHTKGFMAAAKKALGIDLAAVVRDEDLSDYLRQATERNVSLITSLGDDVLKRIEQAVYDNSIAGNPAATLKTQLKEQFGIVDRRAQLIARDQIGKLTADLNRIRQEQAGVTSYSWMTSHDERVRERHRKLDGKEYKWGEATGAEGGLPPGQPIRCRCVARGIVEF
jgi:SPP1 gp7 family putative phage head morphogenesis protein